MAMHEARNESEHMRHPRHPGRKMRARGGEVDHAEDQDEETKEEEKEAEKPERAHGGEVPKEARQRRKHGGKIEGKKPAHRPDKRARGGATADLHPETAAGKMSDPGFERVGPKPDGGGRGMDRD